MKCIILVFLGLVCASAPQEQRKLRRYVIGLHRPVYDCVNVTPDDPRYNDSEEIDSDDEDSAARHAPGTKYTFVKKTKHELKYAKNTPDQW